MRLSGHLKIPFDSPETWVAAVKQSGYSASHVPVPLGTEDSVLEQYVAAAAEADIIIGEFGAWSNPIDPDPEKAKAAITLCQQKLAHADKAGCRCCVNIVGSRNPTKWDGPHPDNFSDETFEMIVATTREIVDAVAPTRTFYTLETMPWIFPSSPDEYLALLKAIDRPMVGVHLDPVNMINSPERIYRNTDFLKECFAKLGPWIKSCHAKDIILRETLTVHLDECRPGTGALDYVTFLKELSKLDPDTTVFLEHLPAEDYPIAAEYLKKVAAENGMSFR